MFTLNSRGLRGAAGFVAGLGLLAGVAMADSAYTISISTRSDGTSGTNGRPISLRISGTTADGSEASFIIDDLKNVADDPRRNLFELGQTDAFTARGPVAFVHLTEIEFRNSSSDDWGPDSIAIYTPGLCGAAFGPCAPNGFEIFDDLGITLSNSNPSATIYARSEPPAAPSAPAPQGLGDQSAECKAMLQDQVEWDTKTHANHWGSKNLDKLCDGTHDAGATVTCFTYQLRTNNNDWKGAIEACRPGGSGVSQSTASGGADYDKCVALVQDKVAWDKNPRNTHWERSSLDKLCRSNRSAQDVVDCFVSTLPNVGYDWQQAADWCTAE